MDPDADAVFIAGLAADDAGLIARSYRLLRPLADAGHAEAQARVGILLANGLHRFESWDQLNTGAGPPVPVVDDATAAADRAEGGRFLEAASAAGIGPASFNLAGLVAMGYGGGPWEERKTRAAALYALASTQGFTAFGGLMNGNGPGLPYLDVIEAYTTDAGLPPSGESRPEG